MPALLFIIGLIGIFFLAVVVGMYRSKGRRRVRFAIGIPSALLGVLAFVVFGGLAWEHYTPPPASVYLAQLQASTSAKDRAAVVAVLKRQGFELTVNEGPFRSADSDYGLAAADVLRSASYLALRTPRVRPHDLFAEYLEVVFLFDADGQLITWSYVTVSPSL
ncbi:hypothetical protein BH09VER1_BH09VER1_43840 [soil metagenome]